MNGCCFLSNSPMEVSCGAISLFLTLFSHSLIVLLFFYVSIKGCVFQVSSFFFFSRNFILLPKTARER